MGKFCFVLDDCKGLHVCVYVCVDVYVCMSVCMWEVCICVYVCVYMCLYGCVYVCVCVCVCVSGGCDHQKGRLRMSVWLAPRQKGRGRLEDIPRFCDLP